MSHTTDSKPKLYATVPLSNEERAEMREICRRNVKNGTRGEPVGSFKEFVKSLGYKYIIDSRGRRHEL